MVVEDIQLVIGRELELLTVEVRASAARLEEMLTTEPCFATLEFVVGLGSTSRRTGPGRRNRRRTNNWPHGRLGRVVGGFVVLGCRHHCGEVGRV